MIHFTELWKMEMEMEIAFLFCFIRTVLKSRHGTLAGWRQRISFYASGGGKIYYYFAMVWQTTSLLVTEMFKVCKIDPSNM